MDARVNDFLNEINEIAPLNEVKEENAVWEKCYDEDSGYYYYWNTKTNEVTWDMPPEYKAHSKTKTKKTNLYIPPRTAPLFPSTSGLLPPVSDAIKIYKIGESTDTVASTSVKINQVKKDVHSPKEDKKRISSKPFRRRSDTEEEKVVLISSYGGDSESDYEKSPKESKAANGLSSSVKSTPNSDDEDDVDILTKIQKKAKELKQSTGEIPGEVKTLVKPQTSDNKEVTGFSLVAGYSDSEDESEVETPKPNFLVAPLQENKVTHSTLFPATKPIDVKDFEESPKREKEELEGFDSKVFQRKRRIGVALVNTGKKLRNDDESERKGLGFATDSNSGDGFPSSNTYPNFKSGGVMFVKADVLNPTPANEVPGGKMEKILPEIEDTYKTLKEKLTFLSEGKEEVSPVQVMLIQIDTLYTALKAGDLKQSYLRKWLDETCSDLVKLEKETTPEGWLLQWDRSHKRYYYQNAATGESQWEYPQADVTVCDEAMDICTTPPPNGAEPTIHMSPPLPPIIGSPSPPPPPTISDCKSNKKKKCEIPLPPEPKEAHPVVNVTEKYDSNGEPLPPGVDAVDVAVKSSKEKGKENDLSDVLNSFYSDIAAIETSGSSPVASAGEDSAKTDPHVDATAESTKKKKKKVKLAQGLAMKKKGVSKLVEKWKSVQMSYND